MNIAVNTRLLLKDRLEGIGWYAFEVLKRITTQHKKHTFYFLFDRNFDNEFIFAENIIPIVLGPQARHPLLYKIWFERTLPKWFSKNNMDLFFSPEGYVSLKSEVPTVNVIHDLNFEHNPDHLKTGDLKFYKKYFPKYAEKSQEIITVSKYSKQDISSLYKVDPEKISVVYNGVRDSFQPLDESEQNRIRDQYSESQPYFIYVGSIHPRKNIEMLLKAFDEFSGNSDFSVRLLISGRRFKKSDRIFKVYRKMMFRDRVKFLNYVAEKDLNKVVASASALVYIPLFEGFGMPVIEAFKAGVPVLTSNCTSLPEISGNAALLVDPNSQKEIVDAMHRIISDKVLQGNLIKRGMERAKIFSWDKCASETWKILERNLG